MVIDKKQEKKVALSFVEWGDEQFLKISHSDEIRPFFMSIVSDSDHWMFISSNGGLSAGRKNAEFALFPYYTDDKITELADITGSRSIFHIHHNDDIIIWEPFSHRLLNSYNTQRHLYKSIYGNKIVFEEILTDFNLTFRYSWTSSNEFGFVKTATLVNSGVHHLDITLLDGIQNIMPFGVSSDLQRASSNLVDAYKRSELHKKSGLGIYALSAIIVDKAEPSEALKANIAWSIGLDKPQYLMSSGQLDKFRTGGHISEESDIKGEKGAYFVCQNLTLKPGTEKTWKILADVNKSHSQIIKLIHDISSHPQIIQIIQKDIEKGTANLLRLVASADGIQHTADNLQDCRGFSNVLFNIMRGGIFDDNYSIDLEDFNNYLLHFNHEVYRKFIMNFPSNDDTWHYRDWIDKIKTSNDKDLIRLSIEYLPLKFSRRHGDPSRPWNKFSINLKDENTGAKILDYEGNWRDIFQNWEALAYSYPDFIDGMLFKFLNASTFDGYNPYRITKGGYDWETIEPDNPWSYIGYWGDHQIIYLLKFLEFIHKCKPGTLQFYFDKDWFVYAGVPYIIKNYQDIVKNPKDTIDFDHSWDNEIRHNRDKIGADGALLTDSHNALYHVNLIEKLLATVLSKLSNFVPEGGIWMNTQRPEWNDANNALVGNGVSMVTLYYLRRFLRFFKEMLHSSDLEYVRLSSELIEFYHSVRSTLEDHVTLTKNKISDSERKVILDKLGTSASDYRTHIYSSGFWGKKRSASLHGLIRFVDISIKFIDHTIASNKRDDGLYHAYNLLNYKENGVSLSHLDEMLEGQVAVLSSGKLDAIESLELLDNMKSSALFRHDQYSYILYPNKELPGFLQKNNVPEEDVLHSSLLRDLLAMNNKDIIEKDVAGNYHFNGNFKNADDLLSALHSLKRANIVSVEDADMAYLSDVFEKVFRHRAFTGRSGTFYGYEGLGSIYWHMVSKLLLSVQETCLRAIHDHQSKETIGRLLEHYYEIQAGIGVHKSPELYGAFPTDPYSHTPMYRGAQQPGMTGQVKEDILCRWGELGVIIDNGQIVFNPCLLRESEFLSTPAKVSYFSLTGHIKSVTIGENQLFFTFCQVPVIYEKSDLPKIEIVNKDGSTVWYGGDTLSHSESLSIFGRAGIIEKIHVFIDSKILK